MRNMEVREHRACLENKDVIGSLILAQVESTRRDKAIGVAGVVF